MDARLVQREVRRVMYYDIRPHDTCQSLKMLSIHEFLPNLYAVVDLSRWVGSFHTFPSSISSYSSHFAAFSLRPETFYGDRY